MTAMIVDTLLPASDLSAERQQKVAPVLFYVYKKLLQHVCALNDCIATEGFVELWRSLDKQNVILLSGLTPVIDLSIIMKGTYLCCLLMHNVHTLTLTLFVHACCWFSIWAVSHIKSCWKGPFRNKTENLNAAETSLEHHYTKNTE